MEYVLIAGWSALFLFVTWEFLAAKDLPQKYSKLQPKTFRIADVAIGLLAALSIWYVVQN